MATVMDPGAMAGIRERIVSRMKSERDRDTRQLFKDILAHMDAPYDVSWIKNEFRLSQAEFEVLSLLIQGKTRAEISQLTNKQVSTVNAQIHKAYTKCRVSNVAELTALLLQKACSC